MKNCNIWLLILLDNTKWEVFFFFYEGTDKSDHIFFWCISWHFLVFRLIPLNIRFNTSKCLNTCIMQFWYFTLALSAPPKLYSHIFLSDPWPVLPFLWPWNIWRAVNQRGCTFNRSTIQKMYCRNGAILYHSLWPFQKKVCCGCFWKPFYVVVFTGLWVLLAKGALFRWRIKLSKRLYKENSVKRKKSTVHLKNLKPFLPRGLKPQLQC